MNRHYEIGFVIDPEAAEEDVKKVIDSVVEIVKKANANIENVDEWGRRRLAYSIHGHHEGIYTFITVNMKGAVFFEIERRLKLNEKVMRFIINRLDDKMKKANRLTKKWKRMERLSKRTTEEDTIEAEISDEKEEEDHE
jgi:small subunit ribosomal protein S6